MSSSSANALYLALLCCWIVSCIEGSTQIKDCVNFKNCFTYYENDLCTHKGERRACITYAPGILQCPKGATENIEQVCHVADNRNENPKELLPGQSLCQYVPGGAQVHFAVQDYNGRSVTGSLDGTYKIVGDHELTCSGYSEACGPGKGDHFMIATFDVTPCPTTAAAAATTSTPRSCSCGTPQAVGACTATCGAAKQLHVEICNSECPQELVSSYKDCTDRLPACPEIRSIIAQEPVVNGGWSEWTTYIPCTVSCGPGTVYKNRECKNPVPSNNGQYCIGDNTQAEPCFIQSCPDVNIVSESFSGGGGGGARRRSRTRGGNRQNNQSGGNRRNQNDGGRTRQGRGRNSRRRGRN